MNLKIVYHEKSGSLVIRLIKLRCFSAPISWSHIKNTVVLPILIFRHTQWLHLMYVEISWVLVSSRNQVHAQVILDPDYLPGYLSVSYDNVYMFHGE